MNTPYNPHSRKISPYTQYTRRENSVNSNQSYPRCECCRGLIINAPSQRPFSGLSQIETKNLNFIEENNEVGTPHLPSENEQSTRILSSKNNIKNES